MELNISKSESEELKSKETRSNLFSQSFAILALSSTKRLCYLLLGILILGISYLFYSLASIDLILISCCLLILSFTLGFLITGLKFSSGLELAKSHLEEVNDVFTLIDKDKSTPTVITGNPIIDNFYHIAETAAIQPEMQLIKVKEELALVLNNVAAAVILYNGDGSVNFCSPYIQVLTGYTEDQLNQSIDQNPNDNENIDFLKSIIAEEDWQRYKRARLVSHLGEDSLVRFRIKHKSGLELWLESRMVPIIDTSGEVQSVMTITIDVTDSINYQKQIEQQNQDLNDFAYMVSHDLKAPIFTIHGMADALRDDYSQLLPKDAIELLGFITDAAKRLDKLVASVLEYSALSNSNETQAEVSLNETISQVLSDYKEQLKSIDATFNVADKLPNIKADPIRVYQVFSNLIGNAIKYREKSRQLQVSITFKLFPPHLVQVEVKDNGLGIPSNKLKDIFRPYRRAHGGDIEGSGVGLACVKKIIDKLGGQVSVQSVEKQGSSFFITLPLSKTASRTIPEDLERLY